ncbi:MAG: exodeoxyribonuclease V subunit gamma, partial [Desulfobacterales bacterium]|nr:exodeoxyribonuclease V subunit gamma [Desulfobacterales bacterium]
NNPDLRPKDVLVMTPDIEAYAPYIQAVFDAPADDHRRIPFSIADQSIKLEGRIIKIFLEIMRLGQGRLSAFQVMAILESHAVRRRFDLSESDVELIRKWIEGTRIRWGIDAAYRGEMGLPDMWENTWRAGLDRLLMGYAMPGGGKDMFAGVLPFDNMEGRETLTLGKFLEFTRQIFLSGTSLGPDRTLDEWPKTLKELMETFFLPDEDTEAETQIIRRLLNNLEEEGRVSGFDEKISIDVIRCCLEQGFQKEGFGFGFITGSVTFCAMLPMRSIPFKVICMIGMNNNSYPRQSKPLSFDLMARDPRKGDRSRRNDDRYLFLEAILSARENLYISHIGQSIRDNTIIQPSVLVNEILDYAERNFCFQTGKIREHIVTTHRLQPFSLEYFKDGGRLFSYSRENFEAAECLAGSHEVPGPFFSDKLPEPKEEQNTVDLDNLCRFFVNPAKFIINRRLKIYLDKGPDMLQETEPFDITGLEHYHLSRAMLERRLARLELRDFFHVTRAEGLLPHGTMGECIYNRLSREIEGFVEKTEGYIGEAMLPSLDVGLNISGFILTGTIDGIYPERMIRYRYAKIKAKDLIRTWIHHLVLNCMKPAGYPRTSMVAGLNKDWAAREYAPVKDAETLLGEVLDIFREGLIRPIHFFPESCWEYARQVVGRDKSAQESLQKVRKTWAGDDFKRGEIEDLYYNICFRNIDPIDSEFRKTALKIFTPLIEHHELLR